MTGTPGVRATRRNQAFAAMLMLSLAAAAGACGDDDDDGGGSSGGSNNVGGDTSGGTAQTGGSGGSGRGGTSGSSNGGAANGQGGTTATGGTAGVGGDDGTAGAGGEGTSAATLSDRRVVKVADTLNHGEVEMARAALPRLENAQVVAFAEMMITDHTAARNELGELARDQNLPPQKSELSNRLEEEAMATVDEYLTTDEEPLDELYIDTQVVAHAEALATVEQLLEAADNASLVLTLTAMHTAVQMHLDMAEDLQESLDTP